jgi:hypothetical protein
VDASFRSPQGETLAAPAFLYQEFRRRMNDKGTEVLEPVGNRVWKVRFAPTRPGRWTVKIIARTPQDAATSPEMKFSAIPGTAHGYIGLAHQSRYFAFQDGIPFFPLGYNVVWAGKDSKGTYDFDHWIPPLGEAGGSTARIWLRWDGTLSIEYKGERSGSGRYDLLNAWRMDYILDLCRWHGVKVLFTLDSPEPYMQEEHWLGKVIRRPWEEYCAHNMANGGTLKDPQEFYNTGEGARLVEQRLRYIVARWGWNPNIFCWEIWNELDLFPNFKNLVPQIVAWHRRVAAYLRLVDLNRHLISTSFAREDGEPDIWRVQELDFVSSHTYLSTDLGGKCVDLVRRRARTRPATVLHRGIRDEIRMVGHAP